MHHEPAVDLVQAFDAGDALPETLPTDPMPLLVQWQKEAWQNKDQPNPNAMTLCTVDPDGRPSARIVLAKDIIPDPGYVIFYTNRMSRKGRALEATPRAALVLHWDHAGRQVRIEGPVLPSPDAESDQYFRSRSAAARLGAWASAQSEPVESRQAMLERVLMKLMEMGIDLDNLEQADVPRPPYWGGYRVWAERVELWVNSDARIHDRAMWTRTLTPAEDHFECNAWVATRLQP